jgi:transcriptional regulator with XRE-family HTH domain
MDALETGKRIQQLRKEKGWTQKDLAQRLSVTDKSVSKWERGLNYPDMAMLEPLARCLDTTVVELLGIENVPEDKKVEAVAFVAAEETERLRKDTRERSLFGMIMSFTLFVCLLLLGPMLIERGVYDLPLRITRGCLSMIGFHMGNYIWIWFKYKK